MKCGSRAWAQFVSAALLVAFVSHGTQAQSAGSPADMKIRQAMTEIQKDSKRSEAYNRLGMAYVQRARETSDAAFYTQAESAAEKSLALAPDNFEAEKVKTLVLLGRHDFQAAKALAIRLNRRAPDDVAVYGMVADASMALGDYDEAENAAQWMLDMRPGNVPGLLHGAELRVFFGDPDGAIDFLNQAAHSTAPSQTEGLAWIYTRQADILLMTGNRDGAEKLLQDALRVFPEYPVALESLADLRLAQGRALEAVKVLKDRNQHAPTLQSEYAYAAALESAGKSSEAKTAFEKFATDAEAKMETPDNSNADLVAYYAVRGQKPRGALRLARKEAEYKHDAYTLDTLSWALHVNGNDEDARKTIDSALSVGLRDARLFYHAGVIYASLGEDDKAHELLKKSLSTNPYSDDAGMVKHALNDLGDTEDARS